MGTKSVITAITSPTIPVAIKTFVLVEAPCDGASDYFLNRPNPTRTCTVLIPGFGVVKPALEMCR